jgi:hypothetical protein
MVSPTMFGIIIEARDQVRITILAPLRWTSSTRLASLASTKGPFLMERDIIYRFPLLRMIILLVRLLRRVLYPRVGFPQGVLGPGMPIGDLPSPPPWG